MHKLTASNINERLIGRYVHLVDGCDGSSVKALFECDLGHQWAAKPYSVLSGTGCPHCSNRVKLTRDIVNERIIDRGLYMIGEYKTVMYKSKFMCDFG